MNQIIRTAPRLHPLVAAAAVSVIAVSAAGVGVLTGIIPASHGQVTAETPLAAATAAAPAAAPLVTATPAPAFAVDAAPVAKPATPRPKVARTAAVPAAHAPATLPAVDRHAAVYRDSGPWGEHGGAGNGSSAAGTGGGDFAGANGVGYGGTYGNVPPMAQAPVALPAPPPLAKPACANCGVIEAVTAVDKPGEGTGLGMAGGALGGAVVGKQFGKGHGQDLLTVLGAVGGAFAGHQVEKSVRTTRSYEVRVRMEDGSVRSITQSTPPAWRNGDRVKVDGGSINASYS